MEKDKHFQYLEELFEQVCSMGHQKPNEDEVDKLFEIATLVLNDSHQKKDSIKFLLLTLLTQIFEKKNMEINGIYTLLLMKRGITGYLSSCITNCKEGVQLYCLKKCIATLLSDSDWYTQNRVASQDRIATMNQLIRKLKNNAIGSQSRTTIIEITVELLSDSSCNDIDISEHILSSLHNIWLEMVQQEIEICSSQDASNVYFFVHFLKLWKKLLKQIKRMNSPSSKYLVYLESLNLLIFSIDKIPVHSCCDAVEVICTAFKFYNKSAQNDIDEMINSIACKVLQPSVMSKVLHLMEMPVQGGFLGVQNKGCHHCTDDRHDQRLNQMLVFMCLKCCSYFSNTSDDSSIKRTVTPLVCECLCQIRRQLDKPLYSAVVHLYQEQDDHMFQAALALLVIYLGAKDFTRPVNVVAVPDEHGQKRQKLSSNTDIDSIYSDINPHKMFLTYLDGTNFDCSLLLDFIISPETCFLQFFTKYLKCIVQEWDVFVHVCEEFELTKSAEISLQSAYSFDTASIVELREKYKSESNNSNVCNLKSSNESCCNENALQDSESVVQGSENTGKNFGITVSKQVNSIVHTEPELNCTPNLMCNNSISVINNASGNVAGNVILSSAKPDLTTIQSFSVSVSQTVYSKIPEFDNAHEICRGNMSSVENNHLPMYTSVTEIESDRQSLNSAHADTVFPKYDRVSCFDKDSASDVKIRNISSCELKKDKDISINIKTHLGKKTCIFTDDVKSNTASDTFDGKDLKSTVATDVLPSLYTNDCKTSHKCCDKQLDSVPGIGLVNYSDSSDSECSVESSHRVCSSDKRSGKHLETHIQADLINTSHCNSSSDSEIDGEESKLEHGSGDLSELSEPCNVSNETLDKFMGVLIRLCLRIERMVKHNLFPFKVDHLLNLIHICESKYET